MTTLKRGNPLSCASPAKDSALLRLRVSWSVHRLVAALSAKPWPRNAIDHFTTSVQAARATTTTAGEARPGSLSAGSDDGADSS